MLCGVALRCLIVDDNGEFLDAARELLRRERFDVVGVASNAADALALAAELEPDLVLVDIYLGRDDGFELARRLVTGTDGAGPAVILISTYAEKDLADVIAASPAAGFLTKSELSRASIHAALARGEGS